MKGSGVPLLGMLLVTTGRLIIDCNPTTTMMLVSSGRNALAVRKMVTHLRKVALFEMFSRLISW